MADLTPAVRTLPIRCSWYVRASGPKGGAFRWRYPNRRAANRAARRWRATYGRVAEVWAYCYVTRSHAVAAGYTGNPSGGSLLAGSARIPEGAPLPRAVVRSWGGVGLANVDGGPKG